MTQRALTHRAALELAIERDRRELQAAVASLKEVARARVDPGLRVAEHPAMWLGAAFAFGFWLGWRRAR